VEVYQDGNPYDLVTNSPYNITGYPDGVDVEVINFDMLHEAFTEATSAYDREHVTSWLRDFGCWVHYVKYDGPRANWTGCAGSTPVSAGWTSA
jgi:spore coat polysaccharide biosynthesis protein SpsF (cytidylyltransferase family)